MVTDGEATTMRPSMPVNDAVGKLTTGGGAAPRLASQPAVLSVPSITDTAAPARPPALENEPHAVLTLRGGRIDFATDVRAQPGMSTAVTR